MENNTQRVVLITGATTGIGNATAIYLATKGYCVFGTYRSEIPIGDFNFTFLKLDVRDEMSIQNAVDHIIEKTGKIDILINNAGLGTLGSLEDTNLEEARAVFETNVFGVHAMCRAVLPLMRAQKYGTILNISSIAGQVALPYRGIYNTTKFAIEGFSEALSMEVNPFNINVIIVRPGDYKTNIHNNRKVAEVALLKSSAYYQSFNRANYLIKKEINTAWTPDKIAIDIENILRKKNPKLHYTSAPFIQKISISLHWLLPSRLFEKMVSRFYKV